MPRALELAAEHGIELAAADPAAADDAVTCSGSATGRVR
jgi:hypothetical protein